MKSVLACLIVIIGIVIVAAGLTGTSLVQDLLPVDPMLAADDQANHYYLRVVPAGPQVAGYLPYVLLPFGLVTLVVGLILRRKVRGIAA